MLLKKRQKEGQKCREDEEEDVSCQWMNLRKGGYWKLKEEAPGDTARRTCLGRGCGPVVRQTTE
jgi:hypothetical protein